MIWSMEIETKKIVHTKKALSKSGFSRHNLSLSDILDWTSLAAAPSIAKGPGKTSLKVNMPWTSVLRLIIEVCRTIKQYVLVKVNKIVLR